MGLQSNTSGKEEGIRSYLASRQINFKASGKDFVVQVCPFCHAGTEQADNQWKLNIHRTEGMYNCFRCHSSGSWNGFRSRLGDPRSTEGSQSPLEKCKSIWSNTAEPNADEAKLLRSYLSSRGLTPSVPKDVIRFHPSVPYYDGPEMVGVFPALIAKVAGVDGKTTGIQKIYLTTDGRKAPVSSPKKSMGTIKGGAIRLGQVGPILGIAEGLETALAVRQATDLPMWSTVSAIGMEAVVIPSEVKTVYIWADLDNSNRGQEAADYLASRLFQEGRAVYILLPTSTIPEGQKGVDWLDEFNRDPHLLSTALNNAKPWRPSILGLKDATWPKPVSEKAYHGILGKIVRTFEPRTEADPVAILTQLIVAFGNVIGRGPHFVIESTEHHSNLFQVIVGDTSKARKGTALDHVMRLFREVATDWSKENVKSGLTSGEGLINAVRDPLEREKIVEDKTGQKFPQMELVDAGVKDKRLLALQTEFSAVLRITSRDGNTLSAVIRDAWDGKDLRTLTKHDPQRATDPHVSIIGHITVHELRKSLSETEQLNGFGNRFLWVCAKRSKLLPLGGHIEEIELMALAHGIQNAIQFASSVTEIRFGSDAERYWCEIYEKLSSSKPGMFGAMTARAEAQTIRLSCIYALLDCSSVIRKDHLEAALAVWSYSEDSCRHIFGNYLGDPVADKILEELRQSPNGLTRTEIRDFLKRKKSSERIGEALRLLLEYRLARCQNEETAGRPIERWFATSC